jgi:hypothetical protein
MLRQFAAIWIVFFGAVAAWQGFHHHRQMLAIVVAIMAVTIGPVGVAWPNAIRPIFVGWMTLAYPIGWTVSRIVLGAVFYGLFTPIGLVFRMMGRDELGLKRQAQAATYWQPKPRPADKAQYLRQF